MVTRGGTQLRCPVFSEMLTNCCEVENANNSMEAQLVVFLLRAGNQLRFCVSGVYQQTVDKPLNSNSQLISDV